MSMIVQKPSEEGFPHVSVWAGIWYGGRWTRGIMCFRPQLCHLRGPELVSGSSGSSWWKLLLGRKLVVWLLRGGRFFVQMAYL